MSIRSLLFTLPLMLAVSIAPSPSAAAEPPRKVELSVTDEGFQPAVIKVKKGEHLLLIVTRKSDSTCAKEIVIKEAGVREKLPLNKPVCVSLTPTKTGELKYSCAMGMVGGVISVE